MNNKKESFWIPYADLMTVSMVIFLFIAVAYMALMEKQKAHTTQTIRDYVEAKDSLFHELNHIFKNEFKAKNLEIDSNLTIRFINPTVFFDSRAHELKTDFKKEIGDFFPKYLTVIMQPYFRDKIAEIRIEGHTDTLALGYTNDSYIDNVILSQQRSLEVLKYIRTLPCYDSLSLGKKNKLQFWLTANGLSFGRTLDVNNDLTFFSHKAINNNRSRRVEFRIVTTSDASIIKAFETIETSKR